jgi:teichuronic acid biosynthesis glycosyltransferase TuaC
MKILCISHLYPTKENSVIGSFVQDQVEALVSLGHEVDVVVPKSFFWLIKKPLRYKKAKIGSLDIIYINHLSLTNWGLFFSPRFIAKKIFKEVGGKKYDLIYAHTLLPDGVAALILGRRLGVPISVYIHGADVQKKACIWYLRELIIRSLNGVNQILVNSNKTRKLVDELLGKKKAILAPLGLGGVHIFPKKKNKVLKIVTVGNLVKEKGHDFSVLAVKELIESGYDIDFEVIGSGVEEKSLKSLAAPESRVKFLGRLDGEAVYRKMAEADIFLLPSHNEAFGVVYIESLWQKTPIIGCIGQGVGDILTHGECGILVKAKDVEAIKRAVIKMMDPDLRRKMGEVGHNIVKEKFNLEDNIKTLQARLMELMK